ncbi:MAG: hypothetical protein EZS26_003732 [Candidatus Ordinivivax streblomastigis]|uniref:Circularly permuted ATP-grasp type 2 domain-containing protein n=1 Tax=Candidatus Ordinivivax streblomastigis TaxID=2540710 RepID=A0A5M8NUU1_9BACT|nr:MAG: hypothetical protein EZS26_003732 [Candidatus Ordinivivax streblomastigis]
MHASIEQRDTVNKWLERFGVRFGIYKGGVFHEQLFPFDPVPRVIPHKDWKFIEKGLIQRVKALNLFLADIYHEKQIVKDGIIPEEFIYSSKGYLPQCEGITPSKKIYVHIAGIDLVEAKDGSWIILEDNLRIPSGASYPIIARTITRKVSPHTFECSKIADNRNYTDLLRKTMDYVNVNNGLTVILTPGRYNSAFFEHSFLSEKTEAVLAFPGDLVVENDEVYYKGLFDAREKVGVIYRRISDEFLDPLVFDKSSLLGVPNLMRAYAKGNVAVMNALGNGVADDKGLCYFVPKMIEYYLKETPMLQNAPTYLPYYPDDRKYVLSNIHKLVIKDVSEAGGYGVMFGQDMNKEELNRIKHLIETEPRRWIAQEVIDFKDLEVLEDGKTVYRKADLRAFVLCGEDIKVWQSGLTRFARQPDSFVVNSSQGGGFKDTWIEK